MADKIQLRAGNKASMPTLSDREIAYVRDENALYIGTPDGNKAISSEQADGGIDIVTPQMFGAVGDGVADDTDAVQAALDNGGIIYFPAGRYKVTRQISALMPGKIIMASPYPTSGEADLPRTEDELECGARIECYNNDGIGFLVGDSIQVDGLFIRAKTNFSGILLKYDGSQGQRSYPSTSSFRNILLDSGANSNKLVSFFDFCPSGNYGICVEKVVIGNKYMYQFSDYGFRAEFDEWANSIRLADFVVDVRATHPVYIKNKTGDSGSAKNWVLQNITIQAQKFTADMLVPSHQNCFYMDYVHQVLLLGCKVWDYGWSTFTGDVVTAVGCSGVAAFGCDPFFADLDTVLTAQLDDAANHLNIESLVLTADEYDNKTTVKMTDGTHQKTVDINKVSLSDEQIGSAVGLWMDENMTPHEVLGRNKFNPDDENNRMGYLYAGGGFANSDAYWTTGYIPVSYGVTIRCSDNGVAKHLSMVAAYDAGKGFIAREGYGDTYTYTTVSENVAFVRIVIKTAQIPFENIGTTMITLDDPYYEFEEYGTHMEGGMGQYSILMSPNGTKYSLAVDDDGNLYASPV